jgi:drug/metabolite transporter (DMT)-like permease
MALLAAALFGAATPASKWLLGALTPLQLAGLLYLGAALGVAPALLRARSLALPRDGTERRRLVYAVILGGGLGPVLLLLGLRLASAASVALWLNLELAATALLGALWFRDRLGALGWLGAGVAVGAGLLLSSGEGAAGLAAGALVAAACLCWAFDNHWTALLDGVPAVATTFWKGAAAGLVNLALGVSLAPFEAPALSVGVALATGALCYGASIALYVTAAQALGATRAQVAFASAPLFGVGLAALWLGEPLTATQAASAVALALSVALVLRDRHGHAHTHEAIGHVHRHRHDDGHHLHAHPRARRRTRTGTSSPRSRRAPALARPPPPPSTRRGHMSAPRHDYIPAAGHDRFLRFYDPLTRLLGADRVRARLLDGAAIQPGERVLDLGCGTGALALLLKHRQPEAAIVGLDPDPDGVGRAPPADRSRRKPLRRREPSRALR